MTSSEPAGLLPVELFILLLALATGIALVARRVAIPNSVALVIAGLGLAIAVPGGGVDITPDLILAVLLPGLVFEAAYKIDVGELRRSFRVISFLAAPGVIITAAIVAVVVSTMTGLDARAGLHPRGDAVGDRPGRGGRAVQATPRTGPPVHGGRGREPAERRHGCRPVRDRPQRPHAAGDAR